MQGKHKTRRRRWQNLTWAPSSHQRHSSSDCCQGRKQGPASLSMAVRWRYRLRRRTEDALYPEMRYKAKYRSARTLRERPLQLLSTLTVSPPKRSTDDHLYDSSPSAWSELGQLCNIGACWLRIRNRGLCTLEVEDGNSEKISTRMWSDRPNIN